MSQITREEFSKVYNEQFVPILEPLEIERVETEKKVTPFYIPVIISVIVTLIGFMFSKGLCILLGLGVGIPCIVYIVILWSKLREKLKKQIITKILSLCGNMYMSDNKDIVSSSAIREMGLFPRFSTKTDDDVIVGVYNGCNFAIEETTLTHTEGSGKSRHTVTDFAGLIVKIKMNKNFNGETIVGPKWDISKKTGHEEVKLEDVEFMKHMKVFSNDQIEARYLLTTAFIERLFLLGDAFSKNRSQADSSTSVDSNVANSVDKHREVKTGIAAWFDSPCLVSAAFIEGYVYLFVPKTEDFFEIGIWTTLLNENKYYNVYSQLQLILSIIEYLKLDLKLGL